MKNVTSNHSLNKASFFIRSADKKSTNQNYSGLKNRGPPFPVYSAERQERDPHVFLNVLCPMV
jgi:hypothetical protein